MKTTTPILRTILLIVTFVLFQPQVYADVTKTVGGAGANYATLKQAFDAINSGALKGVINLQITGSTTESASNVLSQSGSNGLSSYTAVNIYPTTTGIVINGNFNASLIDINSADNITIDGRVNATGSVNALSISNANTGISACTMRFINSAENNTVKYCNLSGSGINGTYAVIFFSTSSSGNGNDNNTLESNNITGNGSARPLNAITSFGTSGRENTGNIILNNNIYNFLNTGGSSNGIIIGSNSTDWVVSGNSFYETTIFIPTGAFTYQPIRVTSSSNHLISGNYIGGSAPQCGGSAFTVNANTAHYFCGIYITGGTSNPCILENNIIQNISYSSIEDNPWDGILVFSGDVNVIGNTIGATTGTGSITINTPLASATTVISGGTVTAINVVGGGSGYTSAPVITFSTNNGGSGATATAIISSGVVTGFTITNGGSGYTTAPSVYFDGQSNLYSTSHGLIQNSNGTVNVSNNNIGSITTVGSAAYSHGFETMYSRSVTGLTTFSDNLIGSLTTPNSIYVSSSAVNALQKQDVYGIYSSGIGTTIITGNTVANLTNAFSGTNSASRTRGIQTIAGSNTIQNNIVRNISTLSAQTGTKASASVIGISQISTTAGTTQTVSENKVFDLTNTNTSARTDIYGIYYAGPSAGTNLVSNNFIHSISFSSSNISCDMEGIVLYNGLTTTANNIINLGVNSTIGYKVFGIWDEGGSTNNNNIYYNTVYIGGIITGQTSNTSALWNQANTSTRNYRNNNLINLRSGGYTGNHYSICLAGVANLTINYNNYYSPSSGLIGKIGTQDKNSLSSWKNITSQDVNSLSLDPVFSNAGGTSESNYYTSASLPAVGIAEINADYFGVFRAINPKIGALELNNYTWKGTTSTNFGTASNWLENSVPSDGANIFFDANPTRSCYLDQNRIVGNFTNAQSTDKLVLNGKELTINGNLNFTNSAQIDATATSSVVVFGGSVAQNIPSGSFVNNTIDALTINNNGLNLNGNLTVTRMLMLTNGAFTLGANTLTINGAIAATSGTLTGGGTTNISIGGSSVSTSLPAVVLNNLTLNRAAGISLSGSVSIGGTLALTGGVLTVGANTLTVSGNSPTRTSGSIDASNASANLIFLNTAAITLPASILNANVNNLTVSGAGGVTSNGDLAVNAVLNLQAANLATKGALDMWDGSVVKTVTMGANATTIGIGDVTGIVKRITINPYVLYTFGNQFVSAYFPNEGTLPTQMSVKVKIGTTPSWRAGAINRETEIIQTGGSGTKAVFSSHYQDSELNGNDEEHLVLWSKYLNLEYGRSAYNAIENWVSLSNINVAFFSATWDDAKNLTLDENSNTSTLTWNGSVSDSWTTVENWTPNVGPSSDKNINIPDASTTPHSPTLPLFSEIKTITVEQGGILNSVSAAQLTLNGSNGAWFNQGVFNANTSNVIFTNANATMADPTNFYNVTIANGAALTPGTNNTMRIAGALTLQGTGILRAALFPNTIEFNGINQTIINPNGTKPGFYNLILSGSGTKTMPASALSIAGDFTLSGTATSTAGGAMAIVGNLSIGEGTIFNTGSYNHSVGGNFENKGTFTPASGCDFIMNGTAAQWIGGTSISIFNNLTINNNAGVTLYANANVNNALTLTAGNLVVDTSTLGINGTINKIAGYIDVNALSSLSFGGANAITIPTELFDSTPSIANLTINRSGGVTLGNQNVTINGLLNLLSGTLTVGANTLTLGGVSPTRTSGNVDVSNSSATLAFTNPTAIILPVSMFTGVVNNLTINGAGGVTSTDDFTLEGVLNLQSENPSSTKGDIDMLNGSTIKTLTMGANATTIGIGDVTGIVKRTTINPNVTYTFGNQFSTAYYPNEGILPTQMSVSVKIGSAPSWNAGAIKRESEIIQTGGSGTKAVFSSHYQDSELNGNDEEHLVLWSKYLNLEYGRSDYNTQNNWVSLSNINVAFFSSNWDATKNLTLDEYSSTKNITWNGSVSDSWTSVANWTPNVGPSSDKNIIIPDASTTPNSPMLPSVTEIKTLTIDAAGVLNSVPGAQLTVNGGSSAWSNVGGTFNPNTSTVIFTNADATITGTTNFYNLSTNTGKVLWMISGSTIRIAGTMTNNGTWRTVSGGPTTVEYNGGNQTVVVPNPTTNRYSTLVISGNGNKIMPSSALEIVGDFITSGTATATANAALTIDGNVNIGSGSTFVTGNNTHSIAGDIENNGTLTATAAGTVVMNSSNSQVVSGTGTTNFNNLSISNTSSDGTMINNNVNANSLNIANGSKLTITPMSKLNVAGSITNNAGVSGLVVKASPDIANGSLIYHNGYNEPVKATVEMYSKASKPGASYKWQFFGIPLRTMVASPTIDGSYVREMHEDDSPKHWYQLNVAGVPASYISLNSFTGYEITQASPKIISFQGELENKDFDSGKLSYSTGKSFPGQHLISNPYAAAIDVKKMEFGSADIGIIDNTIYLYNSGSIDDWSSAGSGSSVNPYGNIAGQYTSIPKNLAGTSGILSQVPSMQAFLVVVKSDNALAWIKIPYSATGTMVKNTEMQRASVAEKVCTRIDVSGSRFADRMWIFTEPGCTDGFDNGWDGEKMIGTPLAPQLFAMEPDGNYQVNAIPDINNTELGFQAGEDSNYKLTFTHENTTYIYPSLYLVDLQENTTTDISQSGTEYSFTASFTASPVKRFKIITSPNVTTDTPVNKNNSNVSLKVFCSQKTIFIHNYSDTKGDLMLYDVSGRFIQKLPFSANIITTIPTKLPVGAYVVKGFAAADNINEHILIR